ncbi:MAG: hypothetical protein FJ278_11545, partial [Planctomycetes bacterium]|nr:hypothetical protein [Planctomycetota bacterium]
MATPSDAPSLLTRIRTVGQAELRRLKVIGLSVLVILLFGAFLCFSASDIAFKLDKGTRLAAAIASLAGLAIAMVKLASLYVSRKDARDKIAAEVETKWPELEASLTTSVEFGSDPKKAELLSSPEIVAKLIEQTEERSRVMNFLRVVNWRLAAGLGVVAGLLVVACLAYAACLPRLASLTFHRFVKPWANVPPPTLTVLDVQPKSQDVRKFSNIEVVARVEGRIPREAAIQFAFVKPPGQPGSPEWQRQVMEKKDDLLYTFRFPRLQDSVKFRVKAGDCTTDEYLLDVYEPPKILKVTATFRYPEYTGLQAKTEDDFLGPISAIKGTVVELTAVTNVPVTRAALALRRERALFADAEVVEPTKVKTALEVHQNLKYALFIQDAKGRVNSDAPFHAIKVIPDKAP